MLRELWSKCKLTVLTLSPRLMSFDDTEFFVSFNKIIDFSEMENYNLLNNILLPAVVKAPF